MHAIAFAGGSVSSTPNDDNARSVAADTPLRLQLR